VFFLQKQKRKNAALEMSIFFFQVETMASGLAKVCQPSFALAELKWLFFGG